ncbi:hypothetical protein L7F22_050648 [Adiantum nelumboides]|nr:hypothetical protein [Adiantum nelumboides]
MQVPEQKVTDLQKNVVLEFDELQILIVPQVKMINNLSLELKNEKNSNMVMANEAVSKINQLQEEKALLSMECSQDNEIEDLNLQLTQIKNMEFSSKLDDVEGVMNDDVILNDFYDSARTHIVEVARALMSEKNMPPCYCAKATSTVVYTMNKTPIAAVHDMTPKEKFTGKKPNVSHFKLFGCIAYVHLPDELRTKLDLKAERCFFIGYSVEQKGYKCYNPVTRQVSMRRDVVFDEMAIWYADVKDDIGADVNKIVAENLDAESQGSPASSHVANPWSGRLRKEVSLASSINVSRKGKEKVDEGMRMPNVTVGHDDVDGHSNGSEHSFDEELGIPPVRPGVRRLHVEKSAPSSNAKPCRSRRNRYTVERLMDDGHVAKHFAFMAKVAQDVEPTCFEEATVWQWNDGNGTWELMPLPKGKKPIGNRWVYKVKHNSDGSVSRYKARLVAKGYA